MMMKRPCSSFLLWLAAALILLLTMLLCVCVGSVSVAPKDTLTAIFCALRRL